MPRAYPAVIAFALALGLVWPSTAARLRAQASPASAPVASDPTLSDESTVSEPIASAPDAGSSGLASISPEREARILGLDTQQSEQDRAELLAWIDELLGLQPQLERFGEPGLEARLRDLRAEVLTMPAERVHRTRLELGSHPGFWELPELLVALFNPGQPLPPFYAAQARAWASARGYTSLSGIAASAPLGVDVVATPDATAAPYPTMDPFPPRGPAPERPEDRGGCTGVFNEGTCDECGPQIPLEAVFAAKVATLIANGVKDSIGTAAQDTCAPPGVGFTVPDPVYYVTVGIAAGLEFALASLEFINDLNEECENDYHAAVTDLYLDETISSRVSQASFDDHARLQMRVQIERTLLFQSDERISLFQLPQDRCGMQFDGFIFCGKLELVREIVDDTITKNLNASSETDINNATAELEAGDMHYMSSQWKAAFERYSRAYRLVVKQESVRAQQLRDWDSGGAKR